MEQKISFVFSKNEPLIYISHLDLLRLLGRSARRAGLPVGLTQGYSPHLKIKLIRALKLGIVGQNEEGEIVLNRRCHLSCVRRRWQRQLPSGIVLKDLRERNLISKSSGGKE